MSLTKQDIKDIGEIVGVTVAQYHELNVQPEFEKIHEALANLDAKVESGLSNVNRKLMDLKRLYPK